MYVKEHKRLHEWSYVYECDDGGVGPVPDLLFTYTSSVKALSLGIPHSAAILGRQPLS